MPDIPPEVTPLIWKMIDCVALDLQIAAAAAASFSSKTFCSTKVI